MRTYLTLSTLLIAGATWLRLWRTRNRWVRMLDFPVLQLSVWNAINLALLALVPRLPLRYREAMGLVSTATLGLQIPKIFRYTALAPLESVAAGADRNPDDDICLLVANILMTNRRAADFRRLVERTRPDVILVNEPDTWWEAELAPLDREYPFHVKVPQENTYGMMLFSRLPIRESRVHHLLHEDVPSIRAVLALRSGREVELFCVHPRPPSETDTDARDAELLLAARMMKGSPRPGIVAGDLNDVAWSRTTRLFQKESCMLDPRAGRGFFNTFHARYPFLRYPLDHIFYSPDFALVGMEKLDASGSDHFPILVRLNLGAAGTGGQRPPEADAGDAKEAEETIREAQEKSAR